MFHNKVVLISGASHGIGKCIKEKFENLGAIICSIDLQEDAYFVGDVGNKNHLEQFVNQVAQQYGKVDYLINNAPPPFLGIHKCSYEEFVYAQQVGVVAPFYLTKLCLPYFQKDACVINISSSRDRMSQPQSESYTAAKGGIAALTHSLAVSLAGKVRVNSISPGWIDTFDYEFEQADLDQHPSARVGKPEDIAELVLFLCSDRAGFINGENICVDGGMTKLMIYHNENGWTYKK